MLKSVVIIAAILNFIFPGVLSTSDPYTPEKAKYQKEKYCQNLIEIEGKLPDKYKQVYQDAQTRLCPDETKQPYVIETIIRAKFTPEENTEIGVRVSGKKNYCSFIFGLSKLYRLDGRDPEDADKITNPEYKELKEVCDDSSKGVADVIPLAQKLAKIYYHF